MVRTEPGEDGPLLSRVSSLGVNCDEDYPPVDGDYQNRTYFRPLAPETVLDAWRRTAHLIGTGRAPSDVGLYIHWPFCPSLCSYCYCDRRAGADAQERARGLDALRAELRAFAPALRGISLSSVQLYGGTPTAAGARALDALLGEARTCFAFAEGAQVCVEASPATLDAEVVGALARAGVTRVDLGVDSLDAAVLARDRPGQDERNSAWALERLLAVPGLDVGVSLIFGVPGQTPASFLRDLGWALRRRPRRLLVYGFDPRPQTAFVRGGGAFDAAARERVGRTVLATRTVLDAAGYRPDADGWRPASSLLGVGWSATSRAFGSLWYQHPPLDGRRVADDSIPPFLGMESSRSEEMRGFVVRDLFVGGRADAARFRTAFGRDLAEVPELRRPARALVAAGLARLDAGGLELTAPGAEPRARARRLFYSARVRRAVGSRRGPAAAAPCLSYVRGGRG